MYNTCTVAFSSSLRYGKCLLFLFVGKKPMLNINFHYHIYYSIWNVIMKVCSYTEELFCITCHILNTCIIYALYVFQVDDVWKDVRCSIFHTWSQNSSKALLQQITHAILPTVFIYLLCRMQMRNRDKLLAKFMELLAHDNKVSD